MRTPRLTRQLIASSVLAASLVAAPTVALAASHSGTDSRDYPDRIFADDSFWYRQLPDDTPVAANSSAIVDHLYDQAEAHWGAPGEPYDAVARRFTDHLPASAPLFNEYHALLVQLGKTHCKARAQCEGCPLGPARRGKSQTSKPNFQTNPNGGRRSTFDG